jgi:hypothetical protein
MPKRWIHAQEWYTWFPNHKPDGYRYENGKTIEEKFPSQYKQIPDALHRRLETAVAELRLIEDEIDNYGT